VKLGSRGEESKRASGRASLCERRKRMEVTPRKAAKMARCTRVGAMRRRMELRVREEERESLGRGLSLRVPSRKGLCRPD